MAATAPLLQMEGISKAFPGVRALEEASLAVGRGEVHAVMGQNGAGKSTLIKILTGAYRRDAGTVTLDGQPVDFHSPQQAQAGGVSTIYQEVNLVGFRSVAENIFLGREPRRWGLIDRRRLHAEARRLLERLGVQVEAPRPTSAGWSWSPACSARTWPRSAAPGPPASPTPPTPPSGGCWRRAGCGA